jgi:transposase
VAATRKPGRPDGLTPEVEKKILDAVRAGASMADAAGHAGVGERTVYDWLERAQQPKGPTKFSQFSQSLTRARADAKVGAIAAIRSAMPEDWRAALAFLERRHPQEWGRRTAHEVSGPEGGSNRHEGEAVPGAAELVARLVERRDGGAC